MITIGDDGGKFKKERDERFCDQDVVHYRRTAVIVEAGIFCKNFSNCFPLFFKHSSSLFLILLVVLFNYFGKKRIRRIRNFLL